jgi:hypothetical protein
VALDRLRLETEDLRVVESQSFQGGTWNTTP